MGKKLLLRSVVLNFCATLSGTRIIQKSLVVALCTSRFNVKEFDVMPTAFSVCLSEHTVPHPRAILAKCGWPVS